MNKSKDAYKAKTKKQIARLDARLNVFKAKLDGASGKAKTELLRQSDELDELKVSFKQHLADVEASTAESWQQMKGSLDEKWDHLSGSLEAIWERVTP